MSVGEFLWVQGWGICLVRNVHFLIHMYTCIGYKLPTFGEYMLIGGFLRVGEYVWSIDKFQGDNFPPDKFQIGQLPPGQVTWPGSCPGGSCLLAVLVSEVQNVWMHIQTSIGREEEFK